MREDLAVLPEGIPTSHLVRPEDRRKLELESGVTWELLSDLLPHLVDFMLVTYEPGGRSSSSGKLTRHSGTEFAFMLRDRSRSRSASRPTS